MEPILNLSPQEFRAALAELQLDPQREADLVRLYEEANAPQQGGRDRGMLRNLLDNIIGFDDEVVTPGERLGAGAEQFAGGLLSDPIGMAGDIAQGGYETIERAMAPGATPMDVMGAAGMAMGAGGLLARPAGSVGMGGRMLSADDVLNLADDDFVTLYHGTTREGADAIRDTGRLRSAGEPSVYLTTDPSGGGYGDGSVVPVRVRRGLLQIDDEFPDGRADFRIDLNRPGGSVSVQVSETPAQQVARLLREGRADEVTDDLMAQADPQEMFRLYEAGETGADMPMDQASRMARAQEMGFANEAYHGASSDFQFIDPEMATEKSYGGGIWFADNPDIAQTYAGNIYDSGQSYPVSINTQNFASSDWRGRPWGDAREETRISFPEQYNRPSQRISDIYEDWASWASTDNAARAANQGELSGLRVRNVVDVGPYIFNRPDLQKKLPETGESIAVFDPTAVRSRFARFDPRLSNLRNLNAANVDPLTGAAAVSASQQDDPLANLRAYIAAAGGVLPR